MPPVINILAASNRLLKHLFPLVLVALVVPTLMPITAYAQSEGAETTETRLRRVEGQMRALQRKVFPDGAGKTFAPEIAPGDPTATLAQRRAMPMRWPMSCRGWTRSRRRLKR